MTSKVEKEIEKEESSHSSTASIAEAILGVILAALAIVAVFLTVKYYKIRKDKENYRIFNNEQRNRAGSVSSVSAGTMANAMHMAYDNPSYDNNAGLEASADQGPAGQGDQYDEPNSIQLNGTSYSEKLENPKGPIL